MALKSQWPTTDLLKDVAFVASKVEPGLTFLSNPSYLFVSSPLLYVGTTLFVCQQSDHGGAAFIHSGTAAVRQGGK